MRTNTKDIYNLYQAETLGFDSRKRGDSFWILMLQATGIFITITVIVFLITNYQYIKSQLVDWRRGEEENLVFVEDNDKDNLPDWWEKRYNLDPANPKDSGLDPDNDQASNLIEFQFNTNPTDPDTDRDGYFDGEEIKKSYNPNGVGRLDSDKDGIYDWLEQKYGLNKDNPKDAGFDSDNDGLNNKEEIIVYQTDPNRADTDGDGRNDYAEVNSKTNPLGAGILAVEKTVDNDADNDGLTLFYENLFGTDANNSDSDRDGYDDLLEISRGYDPTGEGLVRAELEIPSLSVNAPVIWSQQSDNNKIKEELEKGVIHYPGTAFVGMRGNAYLTGHSSYYAWSKSPYKEVLKGLGDIKAGEKIIVHIDLKNNRRADFIYSVKVAEEVKPDDARLFRDYEGYELTLVTCWPIGTDWKRWMVKAYLESPLP